jgi:Zn-dependent protease with chaperone function
MNFFEHQDKAHQNSQKLFGLFALSIALMIVAIYIASLFFFRMAPYIWWHPGLFLAVTVVTIAIISLASAYKIIMLREGGWVIAEQLGGRQIISDIASEKERQLLNIVEEMAIASGIMVPEVYILDRELSINAFAAGYTPNNAVIGVTRGTLDALERDELQGVIGHEFSHILNGDMRLNLRLIGVLHGILFIYLAGELLLRSRGGSRDKGMPIWAFGLILMGIGGIGLFCGRLIKSAVSRQREFLADASAVQFTRNPDGITSVLHKLENSDSRLISPHAETASHMFFGKVSNTHFWEEMLATHPPLKERISRIRGVKIPKGEKAAYSPVSRVTQNGLNQDGLMGFASSSINATPTVSHTAVTPEEIIDRVGSVTPEHFAHAQALLAQLPESLRLNLREQQGAMAILFALALDLNPQIQELQINWLREVQPPELVEQTLALGKEIAQLDANIRLPLVDLTIPAFRQSPAKNCQRVCKCIQGLVKAKGKLSLWDFVLQLILWHRLQTIINPEVQITVKFDSVEQIWSDALLVISALARIGNTKPDNINYAFRSGIYRLPNSLELEKPEAPLSGSFADIKKSLENLRLATPKLKQSIVDACAHTVLVDSKVTPQAADLLRAIAMTLDCPIPPFLNSNQQKQAFPKLT